MWKAAKAVDDISMTHGKVEIFCKRGLLIRAGFIEEFLKQPYRSLLICERFRMLQRQVKKHLLEWAQANVEAGINAIASKRQRLGVERESSG